MFSVVAGSADLDFTLLETDTPKLTHMCKDRPKARKTRSVFRPVVAQSPLIENVQSQNNLTNFFNSPTTVAVNNVTTASRLTRSPTPRNKTEVNKAETLRYLKLLIFEFLALKRVAHPAYRDPSWDGISAINY